MSVQNRKRFTEEEVRRSIGACKTMGGAAKLLGIDWRTFKRIANEYGLYVPSKTREKNKFELKDILEGRHPQYPTSKLLPRLVSEGYKEYKCEICGICDWMGKRIGLEIDHIDGVSSNHLLSNLMVMCPNCHSQTATYKSRNIRKVKPTGDGTRLENERA